MANFLTVKETSELLKVNPMTIYRYIKAKKMTAYKVGKDYRIEKKELDRFLKKVRTT